MWNLFSRLDTSLLFSLGGKSQVSHLLKKVYFENIILLYPIKFYS